MILDRVQSRIVVLDLRDQRRGVPEISSIDETAGIGQINRHRYHGGEERRKVKLPLAT